MARRRKPRKPLTPAAKARLRKKFAKVQKRINELRRRIKHILGGGEPPGGGDPFMAAKALIEELKKLLPGG